MKLHQITLNESAMAPEDIVDSVMPNLAELALQSLKRKQVAAERKYGPDQDIVIVDMDSLIEEFDIILMAAKDRIEDIYMASGEAQKILKNAGMDKKLG